MTPKPYPLCDSNSFSKSASDFWIPLCVKNGAVQRRCSGWPRNRDLPGDWWSRAGSPVGGIPIVSGSLRSRISISRILEISRFSQISRISRFSHFSQISHFSPFPISMDRKDFFGPFFYGSKVSPNHDYSELILTHGPYSVPVSFRPPLRVQAWLGLELPQESQLTGGSSNRTIRLSNWGADHWHGEGRARVRRTPSQVPPERGAT